MLDYKFNHVLVTGGAGFIGSNLTDYLLKKGLKVRVLDNFSTGYKENLSQALQYTDFELIEGDIRDLSTCLKAMKGIDLVFHQAALGSVPRSIEDPLTSNAVNISGFLNILVAARDSGVKRIIYAASSSTYGDHPGLPKVEDKIGKPLSPYAVTKYVNELYADVFSRTYNMQLMGLRYFNVFGPRQNPKGAYAAVIPKFMQLLEKGEAPRINGDGNHARDFTYVENVLQANWQAALVSNPEALNQVYNIGCETSTRIIELFEFIRIKMAIYRPDILKINVKFGPERIGDVKQSLASVDKARRLLNYNPEIQVEEGIHYTVDYFMKSLAFNY